MSELNINDLPPEILITVFRFLDVANLKTATLTCKLWNSLIEYACQWTLELNYRRNNNPRRSHKKNQMQKMNSIQTTNRKIGNFTVRDGRLSKDGRILRIFQQIGFNVVTLILDEVHVDNIASLAELFNFTPNLKVVDIRYVTATGVSDMSLNQTLPDLKKLRKLRLRATDQRIVQCFRKAKPTQVEILEMEFSLERYGPLVDFLLSQRTLTSLIVSQFGFSTLVELGKLAVPVPFQLTQLIISSWADTSSWFDQLNLLRFVKSQAENLTVMGVGYGIPRSVHECIFTDMTKLNTLCVTEIPRDPDFYVQLKENHSVHTLRLEGCEFENIHFYGIFFKKLPNIRSLTIGSMEERSIDAIGSVKFPNLKTLHIRYLYCKINWNEFTKIHSRLAELTIETMGENTFLTTDDIDQITNNVHLTTIRLGVGFVADDRFFEIIRAKCTKLKVLDLHKSGVSDELRHRVGINVLRLCDYFERSNVFESWTRL